MSPFLPHPVGKASFFDEETPKKRIVIHHTEGASAGSSIDWWTQQANHISTPFVIERDGSILQAYDPKLWSFHTGLGRIYDRASIGIEIASEGCEVEEQDGRLYAFGRAFRGPVSILRKSWRSHRLVACYADEALMACFDLVRYLCAEFDIQENFVDDPREYDADAVCPEFQGIVGHSSIRSDKSDPHPLFPWEGLKTFLESGEKYSTFAQVRRMGNNAYA